MNKYPSERLFCLTIVRRSTKADTAYKVSSRPAHTDDDMSEDTGGLVNASEVLPVLKSMLFGALRGTRAARTTNKLDWY